MKNTSLTDQASNNVIRLYKGEETGIINETYESKDTSIFAKQYTMALNEIKAYLDSCDADESNTQNSYAANSSNIFAFLGDRGTGKTSCMNSVANMIEKYYTGSNGRRHSKSFLVLPVIDPTLFNDNTNILHLVIGILFQEFKSKINSHSPGFCRYGEDKFENNKNLLLKAFQEVKDCIKVINNPDVLKSLDDDISSLSEMASISILREKMNNLVSNYLDFFESDVLVLQVDDIDLQTQYACQMIEEIRKYFTLKKVVILMSFKLEQLLKVIELENAKRFKTLIDLSQVTTSDIKDMANKYLLKLVPISHRINMPVFDAHLDEHVEYYSSKDDRSPLDMGVVKYAVTSYIFVKCRYLFYHSQGVVSPIVPRNLRELRHLLAMLVEMPDYNGRNTTEIERAGNKIKFLSYFYENWTANNIISEDYIYVKNILDVKDAAAVNKVVVQQLYTKFNDIVTDVHKNIFDVRNVSYNISIADIYLVVDYIKQRVSRASDKKFIFFIETYYSLKLYEYYDQLTLPYEIGFSRNSNQISEYPDKTIRRIEVTREFSNYEVLSGGNFFPFTPSYKIDVNKLRDEIQEHISLVTNELSESEKLYFNFLELLCLCISDNMNNGFRQSNRLYYNSPFSFKSDEKINIGAFFFNVINMNRAYDRVHMGLYDYVTTGKGHEFSLYQKLRESALAYRNGYNREHALLSCAVIRNFEVMSDLMLRFEMQPNNIVDSLQHPCLDGLNQFFSIVSSYHIRTYDRRKNDSEKRENRVPDEISFIYCSEIANIIKQVDKLHYDIDAIIKPIVPIHEQPA